MGAKWLCRVGQRQTQMMKKEIFKYTPDLEESNVINLHQKVIEETMKKISEAREKLLNDALMQRAKEGKIQGRFNLAEESKKVFPRIKGVVDHKGNEHFIYNDGTDEGLHLVSFYREEPNFDISNDRSIGTIGFKYLLCQPCIVIF